jgi:hypothetical protein
MPYGAPGLAAAAVPEQVAALHPLRGQEGTEEARHVAEREEPEPAARRLEQELNNIAGLIDRSSSPSGPTLEELIRKLDQVRADTDGTVADTQARQALDARQVEMMDSLISRVEAESDPTTLQRTLQGLYASRDADETDPRRPAAYSDYSSADGPYRNSGHFRNEPAVSDGYDYDDEYMSVPPQPVPVRTAAAPASRPEDNSGWASPPPAASRSSAVRRSLVVIVVVLILAVVVAAALALHH